MIKSNEAVDGSCGMRKVEKEVEKKGGDRAVVTPYALLSKSSGPAINS